MTTAAFIGFTLEVFGELLLGLSVFLVHGRIMQERKIDKAILQAIKKERNLALFAIVLIVIGYLLQIKSRMAPYVHI